MRESRTYGSMRGAGSNLRPYRDRRPHLERQLSAVRRTAGSCCGGLALTLRVAELTWFFCQTNSDEGRDDISFCYLNRSSE